ncbi:hypothetical protein [Paeniglutamicibacter kerguelensis]|uniref:Uncharacterized protein n=1 Tax=Paeniglutamicibacter kerguelensis TaxID=254788 RepID=A0ABS4X9Q9_9MICC|nr:hypothetical protein [Paeniglutamicibacter kerguelensis]MBP2385206.1 hypothetical protein [Paeniglutamicibacter kerguelensis]
MDLTGKRSGGLAAPALNGQEGEYLFLPKQPIPGLMAAAKDLTVLPKACARLRIPNGLGIGSLMIARS